MTPGRFSRCSDQVSFVITQTWGSCSSIPGPTELFLMKYGRGSSFCFFHLGFYFFHSPQQILRPRDKWFWVLTLTPHPLLLLWGKAAQWRKMLKHRKRRARFKMQMCPKNTEQIHLSLHQTSREPIPCISLVSWGQVVTTKAYFHM